MPNWREILEEIKTYAQEHPEDAQSAADMVRRRYLQELHAFTTRNIIAYYSGWLSKPGIGGVDINDDDKNGFMMAVHRLDKTKGLDLLLHTPGGDIAATQSIVDYLRKMFGGNIRAVVPQIAMSAGTMVALSCKSIVMGSHFNIGPIDPHLRDIPAYGVLEEFRRAYKEVKKDSAWAPIWQTIIGQYRPTFLSQCENAIRWSNSFVREQLETVMFQGDDRASAKARTIVRRLSGYRANRTHARHIHIDECEDMGLTIERLEENGQFQDLVLTVHHCFMHSLANTRSFKIIENHLGTALVKNVPPSPPQIALQQVPIPRRN